LGVIVSVRKRQWYTNKQVQTWAKRLAKEAGRPEDGSIEYEGRAKRQLTDRLGAARAGDAAAIEALKLFPPREAWIADYLDRDGDQHIKTFERKKDAEAYHATVKVDVRKGVHTAPSKSATVAEAAESWIKRVEADGRERATVRQYRQHVNLHIAPRIGRIKLADLTPKEVEAFRDGLLAHLSRPLARKVLTSLKSLLKVAKHAYVAEDVSVGRSKRSERKPEIGRDIPTTAEIKRLVEAAKDNTRLRALLLTASLTGLRASELRGLRWSDVDLKAGELHVRQRADRYNDIGAPKTVSSARAVPLAPDLLAALKEWKLACPKGRDNLVFPSSTGAIEHHANMLRSLAPVMRAAGVVDKNGKPKYALHAFRHFFASWCINPKERGGRELPAKVVQQLLGHSSIVMTLDRYGHLFPRGDDRAELAKAASALLA
jgi:integrase